jgi:hypothetical protein
MYYTVLNLKTALNIIFCDKKIQATQTTPPIWKSLEQEDPGKINSESHKFLVSHVSPHLESVDIHISLHM